MALCHGTPQARYEQHTGASKSGGNRRRCFKGSAAGELSECRLSSRWGALARARPHWKFTAGRSLRPATLDVASAGRIADDHLLREPCEPSTLALAEPAA